MNSEEVKINVRDEGTKTFYTNGCRINCTPYDFQFDYFIQRAGNNEIIIENMCTILMSPEHTKIFAKLLIEKIAEYEIIKDNIPTGIAVKKDNENE